MKQSKELHLKLAENVFSTEATLDTLKQAHFVERLWEQDPTLWKQDRENQKIIQERLGWLTVVETMKAKIPLLEKFASNLQKAGFEHGVVLGMGGSSLCPDVLRHTFGKIPGFPELHILDTTDPATILNLERNIDLSKTLFLVSSKSGGTLETDSLFNYFYAKVSRGGNFVAITDPQTSLEQLAKAKNFRELFLNPPEIGGRYSALSYFGLVPAALMGLDLKKLLNSAEKMANICSASTPLEKNQGAVLGATLGELYTAGKDKITFAVTPPIQTFGYWVEQLLAESTGKEGKGLVPIEGEPLGNPEVYDVDRLFIGLTVDTFSSGKVVRTINQLESKGFPVIRIHLESPYELGGEFFKWEFATAVAGALMQINAFDQPNVQESKDNTKELLQQYIKVGKLPEDKPLIEEDGLQLYSPAPGAIQGKNITELLASFLKKAASGDYVAIMAYLERTRSIEEKLNAIRLKWRDQLRKATTLGFGPRFLHSTGQLHKGGKNNGLFIQFTARDHEDAKIPNSPYTFGLVKQAQALGDYRALFKHDRRIIRIDLGKKSIEGLKKVLGTHCSGDTSRD